MSNPKHASVAYSPHNGVSLATAMCQAGGIITTQQNLQNHLNDGSITQEEYNEYYPCLLYTSKERLMKFMKHSARVPSSNKIVEKKFVRIGEGSMTYSIGPVSYTHLQEHCVLLLPPILRKQQFWLIQCVFQIVL